MQFVINYNMQCDVYVDRSVLPLYLRCSQVFIRSYPMQQSLGKILIITGIIIAITGIVLVSRDSLPLLRYIGKLPGDISVKRDNISFYFPVTTCILISIILSLVFYLIGRFK